MGRVSCVIISATTRWCQDSLVRIVNLFCYEERKREDQINWFLTGSSQFQWQLLVWRPVERRELAVGGEGRYGVGVQTVIEPVPPPPPSTQLGANTDQISVDFSTQPCEHHQAREKTENSNRNKNNKMLLMQDRVLGETVSASLLFTERWKDRDSVKRRREEKVRGQTSYLPLPCIIGNCLACRSEQQK